MMKLLHNYKLNMTLITQGVTSCAFFVFLKRYYSVKKTQARNRFENIKVVCNCVATRSQVFFSVVASVAALFYLCKTMIDKEKNRSVHRQQGLLPSE